MPTCISARVLAPLLALALCAPAWADGRAEWQGYAWQSIDIAQCRFHDSSVVCPPYREKWDWKRNQWVDVTIALDGPAGRLRLTQRLTNSDIYDDDDVCVTAVVVDAAGRNLVVHHQNWRARHGDARQETFDYRSGRLDEAAAIHIGSKQCRRGPRQDDAVFAAVTAGIVD